MVDINSNDNNELSSSESSSVEVIDLVDEVEIVPDEEQPIESLEVFQEEVIDDETGAGAETVQPDNVNTDDIEPLPVLDDAESDFYSQETESQNSSDTARGDQNGDLDQNEIDEPEFSSLDDEEFSDDLPEKREIVQESVGETQGQDYSEKTSDKDDESTDAQTGGNDGNRKSVKAVKGSKAKFSISKPSPIYGIFGATLLLLIIAGGAYYFKPSLFGSQGKTTPIPAKTTLPEPPVPIISKQIAAAKPPGKYEMYLAKIEEAGHQRKKLLQKKEEIYRLKLYYQNGIAELQKQIKQTLRNEAITSYKEALKRRSIELGLRTIQRRRSYMQGLEKPIHWINHGSEELLYLKRKATFDLELIDIADGIDMDGHMRYIDAAIEKFRPSAENLAINHDDSEPSALKAIWQNVKKPKKKSGKSMAGVRNKKIAKEICSGNYENTAELTYLTADTAQCLSRMNGPDLFLNNLKTLTPEAARSLFKWRGNWICLNGIKKISPKAAKYLFKWNGDWISLNGITEFPPELATFLMEWEGQQLELMGLRYNSQNSDEKALKYLGLWQSLGGKLFVSDGVRKEIKRVLM
jgi:hypothetical protein